MIGRIRGIVIEKYPPLTLLEVEGLGYEVRMPMICFHKLPDKGEEATVFTHCLVSQDKILIFGFNSQQEKILFCNLIKINGIGPKLALVILSCISAKQFINLVEQEDRAALIKLPGIGKKTVEHLIIEMKDRMKESNSIFFTSTPDSRLLIQKDLNSKNNAEKEAIDALVSLGYKFLEARRMVRKIAKDSSDSKDLIVQALRNSRSANYEVNRDDSRRSFNRGR